MLIRCCRTEKSQEGSISTAPDGATDSAGDAESSEGGAAAAGEPASVAAAAANYWAGAADDPYTWRLCLQLVVFPLLSFRFEYPYAPPPPGDAPPPPPQHQQQQQSGLCGADSAYSFPVIQEAGLQQRDPQSAAPWMALPTRRRLTPEVAITTLGLDEVRRPPFAVASAAAAAGHRCIGMMVVLLPTFASSADGTGRQLPMCCFASLLPFGLFFCSWRVPVGNIALFPLAFTSMHSVASSGVSTEGRCSKSGLPALPYKDGAAATALSAERVLC